jgi:hypothetical protein
VPLQAASTALAMLMLSAVSPARAQGPGELYRLSDATFDSHVEYHQLTIPRGKEIVLADLQGPGKVTYFYITDDTQRKLSMGLVLKVTWDDAPEPSILAPLADFFGALGEQADDYASAVMQIHHGCYACYLPMPFASRARFVLANDGDADYARSVAYGIDFERGERYAHEASRLHCTWRRSNPADASLHTLLQADGHGHYVGGFYQVRSTYPGWWGEGDVIFRVDGRPITHAPGTEDEFGSCWGFDSTFSLPYCGYIHQEGGRHLMYRWYVANPVRFRESLKVEAQDQRFADGRQTPSRDDVTSVAFWYAEGAHPAPALPAFQERTAPSRAERYDAAK